jgi:hypothetical protein
MSADDQELYKKRIETNYYYQYNFIGLEHGKTYTFSIRAEFTGGLLGNRVESNDVELSYTVPTAVRGIEYLTYSDSGSSRCRVMWAAPIYNGGMPITGYKISVDGGETWTLSSTGTQITIAGTTASVAPDLRIRAVTDISEALGGGEF